MPDALIAAFLSLDPGITALVMLVFFLAGIIKGLVGFGMPLFAITVLASVISLPTAIAANVGPALVTNTRQAFRGPHLKANFLRLWPFLIPAIGLIWVGIVVQVRVNPAYPGLALGVLAILFAAINVAKVKLTMAPRWEKPIGFAVGLVNGVVTGITGIFILPGGLYIQALGLSRDALVQALGMLFLMSTIAIGSIFWAKSIMTPPMAALSVLAIPPAVLGMALGERLRVFISEALFARIFLFGIAILGLSLVLRNAPLAFG